MWRHLPPLHREHGAYQLKATLTWRISWEGSGGTGGTLPDGTFDSAVELDVQEAQAVNR